MKLDNFFSPKREKPKGLVIGEPYDVKHVYHVGADSPLDTDAEFWPKEYQNQQPEKYFFIYCYMIIYHIFNLVEFFSQKSQKYE